LDWSLDEQQGQEIVRTVERSNQQQYLWRQETWQNKGFFSVNLQV
jgi:hypothetical protein